MVDGSLDTSIRVWDVETVTAFHTLTGHQESLTRRHGAQGNILVGQRRHPPSRSDIKNRTVRCRLCKVSPPGKTHQRERSLGGEQSIRPRAAGWSCGRQQELCDHRSDDGTVKLWDLRTGEFIPQPGDRWRAAAAAAWCWRIRPPTPSWCAPWAAATATEETKLLVLGL
ncbi:hypothetical protein CRUP_003116 [Coryphaenoides rupestris]|nr:hypothetical protein CRUP_003116 [Coryphaenoides rupestris]